MHSIVKSSREVSKVKSVSHRGGSHGETMCPKASYPPQRQGGENHA